MSLYLAEFEAQKRSLFHIISRMFLFKKHLAWINSMKVSVFGLRHDLLCYKEIEVSILLVDIAIYYRPQRSWAKVMFLQASVILSTGGGVCLSACWDARPHPWNQADPPRQGRPPGQGRSPPGPGRPPSWTRQTPLLDQADPPGSRRQHTVNERPVRILLECILV